MILLVLDWIDWPAVFVIIGVSATWAQVWLQDRREQRHKLDIDERLRKLEGQAERTGSMIDQLLEQHRSRKVGGS